MLSSTVDALLLELESGFVVPERYSHPSLASRLSQLTITSLLAMVAIFGSILCCELTRKRPSQPSSGRGRPSGP